MPLRILVIEDNEANLELMRYLLTAFGHQVRLARNAELALPQISKDAFDGILCDIQLPGKSGYDIAKELNANPDLRAIPLLAVTALAMSGDRERIIEAGFKGYITKPIDPESFVSNIEALIHSLKPDSRLIPARLVSQNTETARIPPTLLVVDNQKVNLELACSLLCPLGFLVLTAENIQEAFLHLQNNLVDLILSDICMANGSGFDFIREVKSQAKYSKIPFIFLTSTQTNSVARTKGLALGANRFLFRPIDPEILLSEIQNTLNERGLLPPMAKILIIDDRVANRDLLVTLLGYGGHHLVEASDGLEGLQICLSEKPDLVITDILMPTMDGYEFVRRLRLDPEIAETKILFYTAHYHLEEAINLAKSCGVLEVLKKPCEPEDLLRSVASALNLDSALPSITLQPDFDENHLRLLTNKLSRNVDELRKTNQRLEILVQLGVELGSEKDASRLLQTFCDSSREIVGARFAVVGIPSGEGAYYRHFFTSGMDQATSKKLNRNEALTGALASVISTGRCFRAARDSGFHNLGLPASFPAAKSILVVALLSPLRIYGWICVLEKLGADTFSEEDERLIKMLATQVGRTYENGSLYMHLLDHSAKLAEEITERKRVEAALRDSAARLREAQQIARVGNWSWEPHTQSTHWSEVLFDLFALDPQSTKPSFEKFLSVLHPEDRETAQNRVKAVLSGQDGFADDLRILQPNSQILWIHSRACARRDAQGQLILLEGTDQDITERKRAEVNLQRTVFLLKAVADSTTDAVFVKDKEGKYLLFNQAAADFVGKSIDEVIGQDDSILFDAQSFSQIRARDLRVMETGRVETQEEILTAAGKTRIYNALKAPFWDANGKVIGVIGISRDVTDQRQLEDQLRQAQKMEAVGRLAGGIAHDFNNLLTVINGYGELVLSLLKANDPAREMIQEIVGAGERASSLTRQLLAFSRKSIVEPKIVDPVSLVTDLDKLLRRVVGEDIELSVMSSGNVGVIQIDPGQFEQVIMNMVVNARDAMPKGGFVTIELQNINLDESYIGKHPDAIYGPHVLIAITDSGIGMDAVTQSRIFEPFFTTKGEHGTGLGLATAHGIIKQAGGQVSVYSELGKGTTFKIYLPRIDSPVQTTKKDSKPISQGSESILLVEDEEMVRSLSKHILISLGYRVTEATNGEEALALVEKPGSSFRLLITDVVMPKIGGRELANQLKQKFPDLKVLFLSGYTDDAVVRHGILQAEVAFLQKPFTPTLLAAKVRETLDNTQTG